MKAQIVASLFLISLPVWGQSAELETSRPVGKTLFAIGQEDKSELEFRRGGFKGHPEYTCRVGVDCSTEAFPSGMYLESEFTIAGVTYAWGVTRITITFTLDQDYSEPVLRLARAGTETTVVTVDAQRTNLVTNTMLGSYDGGVFGTYDLPLGALSKGTHTIQFTVADDGKGNGHYVWDALALFAR
jgi:hypothetical protein